MGRMEVVADGVGLIIEGGQWCSLEGIEIGTVPLEAKAVLKGCFKPERQN